MQNLPQEVEYGNIEYKWKLIDPSREKLDRLVSQLNWRLHEGKGVAIYYIGVQDNGTTIGLLDVELFKSLNVIKDMTEDLNVCYKIEFICRGGYGRFAKIFIWR